MQLLISIETDFQDFVSFHNIPPFIQSLLAKKSHKSILPKDTVPIYMLYT